MASMSRRLATCLTVAALLAGCRDTDPLSLLNGCLTAAARSGGSATPTELKCSIEESIDVIVIPRGPVTQSDLTDAGVPVNQAKLLAATRLESARLCTVQLSGAAAPPPSGTDATTVVGESECVEMSLDVDRLLVARGREFTFTLGRTDGRPLILGVKAS
jgi:hypothetical protein